MKMKRRSRNFSSGEVSLLTNLVHKHWKTLESKKSDTLIWKQKQQCWEDLTNEFNSLSQSCEHRQVTVLKKKWDNIKKNIKHKFVSENGYSDDTSNYMQNTIADYDDYELKTLGLLNVETQYGCDGTSDGNMSDVDMIQDEFSNSLSPNHTPSTSSTKNSWDDSFLEPITSRLTLPSTVVRLPPLPNNTSVIADNDKREADGKNKNTLETVTSTKWNDFSNEKLKVTILNKAKIELEMKNLREKHELEIEILKYDLEIKKKMLENLTKQ